jgi:hypothetical protein
MAYAETATSFSPQGLDVASPLPWNFSPLVDASRRFVGGLLSAVLFVLLAIGYAFVLLAIGALGFSLRASHIVSCRAAPLGTALDRSEHGPPPPQH